MSKMKKRKEKTFESPHVFVSVWHSDDTNILEIQSEM